MNAGFIRVGAILLAIVLGSLLPQVHVLSGCVRWLIVAMLFAVSLEVRLERPAWDRRHGILLLLNVILGLAGWAAGWMVGGRDVALAAFFAGISPTATAAPVVVGLLGGSVEYVIVSFLLTNLAIAGLMPFLLPLVLGHATPEAFARISGTVGLVVFLPMLAARAVRAMVPHAAAWPKRWRNGVFGLWVTAIFLVTADSSDFLRTRPGLSHPEVGKIAAVTLLLCAANFTLGRVLGGRRLARECSQSLGQKNTVFTIFLALAYGSPLIALGPTFYVIWHNLWNAWQLHQVNHRRPLAAVAAPKVAATMN